MTIFPSTPWQARQKRVRSYIAAQNKRRPDDRVIKHAIASRPVSIYPRNPSLRAGYQATHLPGVNQRQKAQLQFFTKSANAATVAAGTFVTPLKIQMNGVFDPDSAFSALQPATFAKYMTWYTKCVVTAAKVKVTLASEPAVQGANTANPITWGITLLTNNTSPANIQEAVTGGTRVYTVQFANPDVKSLTQKVDIAKFLGVNDLENNPDYACDATSNPAQLVVSQIWIDNPAGSTAYYFLTCEVDYDVVFYDPKIIT